MTTLTLNQARTIIYSAASSDEALSALREIGAEVLSYEYDAYSVYCDDFKSVTFTYSPHLKRFFVMVDGELVTPEQRKAFLESQQQLTDTVPAVSIAVESHPELIAICPRCDNPQADNFYSPEQETGFIYCSKCGYDEPRDHIYTPPADSKARK